MPRIDIETGEVIPVDQLAARRAARDWRNVPLAESARKRALLGQTVTCYRCEYPIEPGDEIAFSMDGTLAVCLDCVH